MKNRITPVIIGLLFLFAVAGFLQYFAGMGPRENGGQQTQEAGNEHRTVVSLTPALTEIILALDKGETLSGVTDWGLNKEGVPEEAVSVGKIQEPGYEAILDLEPDLVFVQVPMQKKVVSDLDDLGLNTRNVKLETVDDILRATRRIGKQLGVPDRARNLTDQLTEEMNRIQDQRLAHGERPEVLLIVHNQHGEDAFRSVVGVGKGNFLHEILSLAGGKNAYDGAVNYPRFSPEGLMEMDPDIIIELAPREDHPDLTLEKVRETWSQLPALSAVQNNDIYLVDQNYILQPSPRFIDTVRDISVILQEAGGK